MADYKRSDWLAIRDSGSLGQTYRSRERYLHVSALARMVTNPLDPNGPLIPWVQRPGSTYRTPVVS